MKIAFLSRFQDKIERGAETFVKELSQRLSQKHEVVVLSGEKADSISEIIKGNFDVVISMNGRLQSLKASLGRLFKRYKLIIPGQSGIGKDDIWNIAVTIPNIYVGLTDYEANWAKKWAWKTKVVKINNGVDLEKFTYKGKIKNLELPHPIILSVGALTWYKHHERTIKAMKEVNGSLVIVGGGPQKNNLGKLAIKELANRFKIISANYQELPEIYRGADLFVLPSWDRESFGIVYLEAMASGLAVVAPDDLPRREIIGDAGILVNTEDTKEYEEALKKALERKWGNTPRKQAEKFSWDKIVGQYEEIMK